MDVMIHLKDDYHLIKIIINEDDGSRSEKKLQDKHLVKSLNKNLKTNIFAKMKFFPFLILHSPPPFHSFCILRSTFCVLCFPFPASARTVI